MQLYGRRNATNVIPVILALEEIGLSYKRHDVGGSFGGLDSPSFRAMNPTSRIPYLDDGQVVLSESNIIIRYLSNVYGRSTLRPHTCQDCARADQWMEWYKTTLYGPFIELFQMFIRMEPQARDASRIEELARTLGELLRVPNGVLRQADFLIGKDFTMADVPLGAAIYRYFSMDIDRPSLRGIEGWYSRLSLGSAYRSHVMRPFGLTPQAYLLLEQAE